MRMKPVHGVVVATAVGTAAAFGASAIKDTTHLGAAAKAQSGKKVDKIVKARTRTLDVQQKALRKARRYHTPALPAVPAAPGPVPSYSYAAPAQPVATAPPAVPRTMATRHVTLTRVVHRHPRPTGGPTRPNRDATEPTTTTTTTTEETPTTTMPTVTTTSQAPVTHTTTSTTSSSGPSHSGDDSSESDGHDDGGSGGGDS